MLKKKYFFWNMIESDINGIEKWNLVIYDDEKDFYWIRMGLGYLWSTYSGLFYVKLCHRWVTRRCGIAIVRSFWMGVFFPLWQGENDEKWMKRFKDYLLQCHNHQYPCDKIQKKKVIHSNNYHIIQYSEFPYFLQIRY